MKAGRRWEIWYTVSDPLQPVLGDKPLLLGSFRWRWMAHLRGLHFAQYMGTQVTSTYLTDARDGRSWRYQEFKEKS